MKEFIYTIKDQLGIHARPAGMLVKEAKNYKSSIKLEKEDGKSADATRLMAIMTLGIKCGNQIRITVEGEDEDTAIEMLKKIFEENL